MPVPAATIPALAFTPGVILQARFAVIGELLLGGVDPYGSRVYLNDLTGWDGSVGTTLTTEQRAGDDGAWVNDAHVPARALSASLTIAPLSFRDGSLSLTRLVGLLPTRVPTAMVVVDHGEELTADVVQGGDVLSTRKGAKVSVSIALIAPDPRRYGVDPVTVTARLPSSTGGIRVPVRTPFRVQGIVRSGILAVVNEGTMPTNPVITVSGPCPPFTLTHLSTARTLRFHEYVPAGHTLVLDTGARTALLDGVAPRYVTGSWFDYPPGPNQVAFQAAAYHPDAVAVSVHRSAWK